MKIYNKYDFGVVLLIALLAFGGLGGVFQPVRIFALMFAPFVFLRIASIKMERLDRYAMPFFLIWYAYAMMSMIWTPAPEEGLKQLAYFGVHFSMFFQLVFWARRSKNFSQSIAVGWLLAAGLTLPIALYEITTSNHLPMSRMDSDSVINTGSGVIPYIYADTTFGDLNAYSIFLCYAAFFLFAGLLMRFSKILKIAIALELLVIAYVLFVNSSRGAIASFLLIALSFFVLYAKREWTFNKIQNILKLIFLLVGLALLVFAMANILNVDGYRMLYRFSNGFDFSEDARAQIYSAAFNAIMDGYFVGAGIGSEAAVLEKYSAAVANSHNLIIEILIQYGILICVAFLILIGAIIKNLFSKNDLTYKFLSASFLLAFPPTFLVVSGYLLSPAMWIFFGSMYALCTNKEFLKYPIIKPKNEIRSPNLRPLAQ